MSHIVEKAIKLAKKTDSPCIIVDKEQHEGFVVVSLEQYEVLLEGAVAQPHHEVPVAEEVPETTENLADIDDSWQSVGAVLNKSKQFEPAEMADPKVVENQDENQQNTDEEEGTYYFEPIE